MILINKITPFTTDSFQKDLTECLLKNSDNSFISNIVVFSNTPIVLPKNNKVKLIIKNSYSDYDIIEYTKRLYKDEIIIFANPFAIFNNSLIHLERNTNVLKNNDYYLFNRNQKLLQGESIDDLFTKFSTNEKIVVQRNQIWTKEIKSQTNIIKSKFTPKKETYLEKKEISEKKKIDIVIVSVDYNDTLPISLGSIPNDFNVTVVTSSDDTKCQEICNNLGVKCVITDRMYENGSSFNKGKAINDGIKSLIDPEWILLLDADIYLKSDFSDVIKSTNLSTNDLYIIKRLIIKNSEDFIKWKEGEDVGRMERAKGYGFFHLFNIKRFGNKRNIFPENYDDASGSDLEFRDMFKVKTEINTYVLHLGEIMQNWKGRKTNNFANSVQKVDKTKFNINNYFDNIYCLNLDRRVDRWEKVSKEFSKFSINVERWSAIDGDNLKKSELSYINETIDQEKASIVGKIENKYALACLLSHIEIIKNAKSKGYKKILIFEDDVIFSKNFLEDIKIIEKKDWKLFYLGSSQFIWNDIIMKDGYYHCDKTLGTFAYAIDSYIFDELINLFEERNKSVDNYLSIIQSKYKNKCLTLYPNIIISDVTDSDIRKSSEILEYSKKVRWNLDNFDKFSNKYKIFNKLLNSNIIEVANKSKTKSSKKTILFLINLNDTGGAEYVSYQHIKDCRELGYNVVVVSAGKGMFFEKTKLLDVDLYHSKLNEINKSNVYEVLETLTNDVDVVYNCNYFGISDYIHKVKENSNFKYYTIAHSDIEWVVDEIYKHDSITDKYIVIHDKIRNELNKKGVCNTRIYTVPNYIEFNKINEVFNNFDNRDLKLKLGISSNDFIIGMTTRISPDKNILDSIKILSRLNSNIKLLIVGDSPEKEEAKPYKNEVLDEIKKYNLQSRVIITGHVNNDDVIKYVSCFNIALNTSPSEGLPISLLEQMSIGIHCVYPSHGEIPMVLDGYGSVIKINQRKSFDIKDQENYIFNRFKDEELSLFINEILKIYKSGTLDRSKIKDQIKYNRSSEKWRYYIDFIFSDYKDGISFIIRSRNEVLNIRECIKSISDIADEIIYVDHLSTDGTYEEALELSKIYDNLKVFRYDREIPKPGPNYQKNIISIGNSISQYYNFCISKATKKTIFKWDADFIANRKNLKDLISEYSLRTRCDKFSMWFTGETIFIKDGKKYINKNSYYDEYRGFSIINGVKWSDAIRCEYVDREYADNSISLRFEKPCFYEVKRIDIDEFENREGLIDKRDQQDYEIIQNLINNINIPNLVEVDSLNEKVVLTYGTFDTFHFGHLEILRRSKELGDRLIVGLSTDEFNIEKNKNSRFNFEHRKKWIESIKYVDLVIPEESWNQKVEDIRKYNVDIFVMGDDWKGKFDDLPCKVIYLPRTENISSTEIKKIINPTSMNEINNLISNICNDNLRQNQIKMLKTFKLTVEVLEINNIDYWLGYGTLIGCLRHGGFVPWDDDIDLCILKKDFEKFVNIKNNKIEIIKYHDELYRISHNEKSIDIFILEENHEKTLEMTIDEIFPLKRSKFNGIDCYIPNNPEDFFKRKYGNINPMEDCLVWNHEVNNMWISGFEMKKYQIKFKDLDDKWKKYIL